MGTGKREATRRARQGETGDGLGNVKTKGTNFYRDAKKVKTLNMRRDGGKVQRNADGKITKAAPFQSRDIPSARIEPHRKWFTNTRVISQESLNTFREAMAEKADPYQVLLRSKKLPMSLVRDGKDTKNGIKQHKAKMAVESSPFAEVFGPKAQRKRVKLGVSSLADLVEDTEKSMDTYQDRLEQSRLLSGTSGDANDSDADAPLTKAVEPVFDKGQSKRIWNELYKVIDSSDVVIHVLDARDPDGTRCRSIETYVKEEAPHKHLIFVLNKCDLVPTSVAASWVRHLSKEYPTLAFHASITNSFGKGSLIQLLRQFSSLHSDRRNIAVGLIGGPNVGKSSIINTLKAKKVANVAPVPGETKVWQYVSLMRRISMIDCPGVVPPNSDAPADLLLRGVARVEKVENPSQYIPALLSKVKRHHLERTYDIRGWDKSTEFLELLARKGGRLLRGGEPDLDGVAKMVLNDFQRGKIPWFTPPPKSAAEGEEDEMGGRHGRLGEMSKKRKHVGATTDGETSAEAQLLLEAQDTVDKDDTSVPIDAQSSEEDFEGFGSDTDDAGSDELSILSASASGSIDSVEHGDNSSTSARSNMGNEASSIESASSKSGRLLKKRRKT